MLGEFGIGIVELIHLQVISIAGIFEILARLKKMGFSACAENINGTNTLSCSLAGANI